MDVGMRNDEEWGSVVDCGLDVWVESPNSHSFAQKRDTLSLWASIWKQCYNTIIHVFDMNLASSISWVLHSPPSNRHRLGE